ncbi:MAG: hypothetical protein JKY09_01250 [Crocinitomicaceae bacterium]|nr:hypothetical protein [Crocinitomicaceae bacterium]
MTLGFTGIAGFYMWDGYKEGLDILRGSTIRAQHHMDGYDVTNTLRQGYGNWVQGRQSETITSDDGVKRAKELQYYISEDKNLCVGYVRN